jgi:hypothetical protein
MWAAPPSETCCTLWQTHRLHGWPQGTSSWLQTTSQPPSPTRVLNSWGSLTSVTLPWFWHLTCTAAAAAAALLITANYPSMCATCMQLLACCRPNRVCDDFKASTLGLENNMKRVVVPEVLTQANHKA